MDSLDVGVVCQSVFAQLAADTALLVATERNLVVKLVILVHPNGTSTKVMSGLESSANISREYGCGETVHAVVGHLNDVCFILELDNDDDGAEDLIFNNGHARLGVCEDGRLDVVSLFAVLLSAEVDGSTFILALLNVTHDTIELHLADLRALESLGVEWITDFEGPDVLGELLHEGVVDAFLDVDSGTGAAALSVVEVDTECAPLDGLLEISIVKDDVGALASQFERDVLQVAVRSSLQDGPSDEGASGESDLVNHHVT